MIQAISDDNKKLYWSQLCSRCLKRIDRVSKSDLTFGKKEYYFCVRCKKEYKQTLRDFLETA